jgi:hypothetical protein
VPGSEGIDGANGGNDSSATFFEAAASCFGDAVASATPLQHDE